MKTVSDKEKFIWNMMGSLANALSSIILSICVNRIMGGNSAGIFAFAFANAQLMMTIGLFEVRIYQASDIDEKYSFNDYFTLRLITCAIMIISSVFYVLINGFNPEKSAVIILLVLFKAVDCFTDVYGGRFQQKDRIDISGKLFFVRVVCSTLMFIAVLYFTGNLIVASFSMFLKSIMLFFVYDSRFIYKCDKENLALKFNRVFSIVKEVLPLFIGSFILMYLGNAPKYSIDAIHGDEIQNIYNIIFMPAAVINLLSIFIFNPLIVKMTSAWRNRDIKKLLRVIFIVYGILALATLLAIAAVWLMGIPILTLLYGVDLKSYRFELVCVMISGGLCACMTFASRIVTVIRQQKYLLACCSIGFVYAFLCSDAVVSEFGITGAVLSYGISVTIVAVLLNCVAFITILRKRNSRDEQ